MKLADKERQKMRLRFKMKGKQHLKCHKISRLDIFWKVRLTSNCQGYVVVAVVIVAVLVLFPVLLLTNFVVG